jgi:hypothetical protein
MGVQSFWAGPAIAGARNGSGMLSQEVFAIVFLAIIIGWIIIALWTRVIDNVTYSQMDLDKNSVWDTILIAISISLFFLVFVWVIDKYDIVAGGLRAEFAGEDDPAFSVGEQRAAQQNGFVNSFTGPNNASIGTLFPQVVFI